MRLAGKTALITGSTKGIGRTMAVTFAAEGANVIVTGRSVDAGEAVVAEIAGKGGDARFVAADIGQEADVQRLVDEAVFAYGRIDVLVNNAAPTELAAGGGDGLLTEVPTSSFDQVMKVGLYGPFWACKYAIPVMQRTGGGSIINISSYAGSFGVPGLPGYSCAKGALNALTRQVAVDFADAGIRSNAIVIGFVVSGGVSDVLASHPVVGKAFRDMTLTRSGTSQDVAWLAVYLASDQAEFISGAFMAADGGLGARSAAPDFSKLLAAPTQE